MIYEIQSGKYSAKIDSMGAELKSFHCNECDREFIWCGDKSVWSGTSPILFPIVGSVKGKAYAVEGLLYNLDRHGFARRKEWTQTEKTENQITFALSSDEQTRDVYPYDFCLSVTFTLSKARLTVRFDVKNKGDERMYYMLGTHTAFATEGGNGMRECSLKFGKKEKLVSRRFNTETGLVLKAPETLGEGDGVALCPELFDADALVFENPLTKSVWLSRPSYPTLRVDFNDFSALGVWAAKGTDRYICIEPWTAIPECEGDTSVLAEKPNVNKLDGNKEATFSYSISVL